MINNKIKQLRQNKNITQEDLAAILGVSRQTIIAIEKGNYTPSLLLAMQNPKYFNITIEEIFSL